MTPVRKPDDAEKTPTGEVPSADEPELLDDSDLIDADDSIIEDAVEDDTGAEILDADDGIVECLDDDVSEEITGEVDPAPSGREKGEVAAPVSVLSGAAGKSDPDAEDGSEGTTGKHAVPSGLAGAEVGHDGRAEDPLAAFATDPARAAEVDEYAGNEDPTGQIDLPEQPPWEAPLDEATPPFSHDDPGERDEPTGRVRVGAPFDKDAQERRRGEAVESKEDSVSPGFDLEPVGRRRKSRRRPPRSVSAEEFIDEDEDTAPTSEDAADPWQEDQGDAPDGPEPPPGDGPLDFDDDTALGDDVERRTETVAGQDDVRWSALPADEPRAMPDVGPTRVDGQSNPLGPQGEKTLIFDDPNAQFDDPEESEVPFLVIVQGDEEGREIELNREELTLGRGPENDLVFPDIACSRRHAMVEKQGDDWLVIDLGSGNGTLVNSRKIQREVLRDGDEIEIGSTVIQFNQPGAYPDDEPLESDRTPPPSSTTVTGAVPLSGGRDTGWLTRITSDPKQRKYLIYGGAGLGGLMLLMLIIKLAVGFGPAGPTPEEIQRQRAIEQRRQLDQHMERAKSLVVEKQWKDAQLEAQLAQKIDPTNGQAKDYVAYIRKELAASTAIDEARMAIGESNWDMAAAALARISEESEYAEKAKQLKKQIDDRLLDGLLQEGLKMMEAEQYNQALLKFDEMIKRDPGNEEATVYRRQCEEKVEQAERNRRLALRARRHNTHRHRRAKTDQRPSGSLTGQTLSLYRNGEIDRAIEKAELSGSAEHQKLLRQFRAAFQTGEKLAKQPGQMNKAIKALTKAKKLDRQISGGNGKYNDRLNVLLGKVYFVKGVDANMSQRYPEAYKAFVASKKYDSSNARVGEQLLELEKKAKKFYEEAYVIKATNAEAAIKKLDIVVRIVPPDHVYYTKAKGLKAKLQGPLGSSGSSSGF